MECIVPTVDCLLEFVIQRGERIIYKYTSPYTMRVQEVCVTDQGTIVFYGLCKCQYCSCKMSKIKYLPRSRRDCIACGELATRYGVGYIEGSRRILSPEQIVLLQKRCENVFEQRINVISERSVHDRTRLMTCMEKTRAVCDTIVDGIKRIRKFAQFNFQYEDERCVHFGGEEIMEIERRQDAIVF